MKLTLGGTAAILATALLAVLVNPASAASKNKTNQIKYQYEAPNNPAQQMIYDHMKQGHALEHLQELLSPLRLPHPLTLRVAGCDGDLNAWYEREIITLCYELLAETLKNAPTQEHPTGVSSADTIIGSALDIFLHETGHAVFDMLRIPVLGRHEDAADQFSAFLMLQLNKEEARRMILGAAHQYNVQVPEPQITLPVHSFADEHSLPPQRAFNLLCIAYGSDKTLYSDVVEKGFLPKNRAELCEMEYADVAFAMTELVSPHIDKRLASKFREVWTRTINLRRERLMRR